MIKPEIKLYPFQSEGVEFLEGNDGCGGLFFDMGLGKTLTAISYASKHNLKTLIVCPAYLKYNWNEEVLKFTDNSVGMISTEDNGYDYTIVNYEIVHKYSDVILNSGFECVIVDESQYLMNRNSKRTKTVVPLLRGIEHRILLTGTPIKNKAVEFYSQLDIIDPGFCNKDNYLKEYVGEKLNLKTQDVDLAKLQKLNRLVKKYGIRKNKTDVLKDLPSKRYQCVNIDIPEKVKNSFRGMKGLEYINNAKKNIATAKIKECVNLINDHIEQDSKVIVYSQYVDNILALHEEFKENATLHYGGIPIKKRQENINRFQNDPECKVLVGNMYTAVGYTATEADTVIFLDLPWSPSDLKQAEDRAHRIGQKNAVMVKYLIGNGTLDGLILKLLRSKEKLLKGSLEGNATDQALDIKQDLINSLNV